MTLRWHIFTHRDIGLEMAPEIVDAYARSGSERWPIWPEADWPRFLEIARKHRAVAHQLKGGRSPEPNRGVGSLRVGTFLVDPTSAWVWIQK